MGATNDLSGSYGANEYLLVGRERELAVLRERADAMFAGSGSLVLVGGEAGIGKTALVTELVREVTDRGALALAGHCYDLTATPAYGPWVDATRAYDSQTDLSDLADTLRSGRGTESVGDQFTLFDLTLDSLVSVAMNRPVLIVLEDMHWADRASLDLLRFVSRYLAGNRMMIIATYREDEVTRTHPLFQLMPLLVRESNARRVNLRPLGEAEVYQFFEGRYHLSDADTVRLAEYLVQQAEGNPLYLREILQSLEEDNRLREDATRGGWVLDDLLDLPVPNLIQQLIELRLERLDQDHRSVVEVAAIIGHKVDLNLWQTVSEVTNDQLEAVLRQPAYASILQEDPGGDFVVFTHALIRGTLYQGTVLPRRRELHRKVAEAMIARPFPPPDTVAFHLEQARDARAADWFILAGDRAQRSYAWTTAAERFESALMNMSKADVEPRRYGWLCYRLGRLLRYAAPQRGVKFLTDAEKFSRQCDDEILSAFTLADRGFLNTLSGEYRTGLSEMLAGDTAIEAVLATQPSVDDEMIAAITDSFPAAQHPADINRYSRLPEVNTRRGAMAVRLALVGRFHEAWDYANMLISQVDQIADPDDLTIGTYADAMLSMGFVHVARGEPERARMSFARAREAYGRIDHHWQIGYSYTIELNEVVLPFYTTRLDEREHLRTGSADAAMRARWMSYGESTSVHAFDSPTQLLIGEWEFARATALAALDVESDDLYMYAIRALVQLDYYQGAHDSAWKRLNSVLPDGPPTEPGGCTFRIAIDLIAFAAAMALDSGNAHRAREWIEAHQRWIDWSGATYGGVDTQLLWARFYRAEHKPSQATTAAEMALELASSPEQPLARLAAHRTLGELATDQRRFNDALEHLKASLDIASACAAPFERAQTLLAFAELRSATGATAEASAMVDEVVATCEPLGAQLTLNKANAQHAHLAGRDKKASFPAGLTAREIDVLKLVAEGMSDREIAEKLFISRNTVMRHVSHILAKLDVTSRSAAAAEAVRLNID